MPTSVPDQPSFNNLFLILILTDDYYMEKDLLLIMVNHETAFKFKVSENENNIQYTKIMEINAEVAAGRIGDGGLNHF